MVCPTHRPEVQLECLNKSTNVRVSLCHQHLLLVTTEKTSVAMSVKTEIQREQKALDEDDTLKITVIGSSSLLTKFHNDSISDSMEVERGRYSVDDARSPGVLARSSVATPSAEFAVFVQIRPNGA